MLGIEKYDYQPIREIWARQATIDRWTRIELAHLTTVTGVKPSPEIRVSEHAVAAHELRTGHEVGAFLEVLELELPDYSIQRRWLHWGLTSSDLVDTAVQGQIHATTAHLAHLIQTHLPRLFTTLNNDPVPGRTHGQVASPTSIAHRFTAAMQPLLGVRPNNMPLVMLSGSVGRHRVLSTEQAASIAHALGGRLVEVSTQVMPAAHVLRPLAGWLEIVVACEQVALDYRLMSTLGEVLPKQHRVGSSAMPGKVNPIKAEQICGLAKVWRGLYASVVDSRALWLDRDLHHSSVDRVTLPALAELTGYLLVAAMSLYTQLEPVPVQMSSYEPNIDADLILGWTTKHADCPRSVAYRAVSVAVGGASTTLDALEYVYDALKPRMDVSRTEFTNLSQIW